MCVCLLSPVQHCAHGGFDLGPHSAAPGGRDVLCGPSLRLSEVTQPAAGRVWVCRTGMESPPQGLDTQSLKGDRGLSVCLPASPVHRNECAGNSARKKPSENEL